MVKSSARERTGPGFGPHRRSGGRGRAHLSFDLSRGGPCSGRCRRCACPRRHHAGPLDGTHRLDQGSVRRCRRGDARRIEGAVRRRQGGRTRRAGGAANTRRRRGDRRQDQHDGIRLHRARYQSALRHAGQSRRSRPRPWRLVVRRGCSGSRWLCDIAIGSDTGGSVRIPASFCGVTGFKPSRQRVPTEGAFPPSYTLDSIGPLAKTVAACAHADAVLAGEAA